MSDAVIQTISNFVVPRDISTTVFMGKRYNNQPPLEHVCHGNLLHRKHLAYRTPP